MFVTARQLQDLHRSHGGNGQVTLPYRARLTPLAADYVRARKLVLGYSDAAGTGTSAALPISNGGMGGPPMSSLGSAPITPKSTRITPPQSGLPPLSPAISNSAFQSTGFLWWCDGPCGTAKAAIVAEENLALATMEP